MSYLIRPESFPEATDKDVGAVLPHLGLPLTRTLGLTICRLGLEINMFRSVAIPEGKSYFGRIGRFTTVG